MYGVPYTLTDETNYLVDLVIVIEHSLGEYQR